MSKPRVTLGAFAFWWYVSNSSLKGVFIRVNLTEIYSAFSFPFHKEVSSSTVSAQANINFPLRLIPNARRVLTVQT